MMVNSALSRLRKRDEEGFTLIEMVVGMFILGLISILIFNVFQTTNSTATAVQAGTTTVATSQTATRELTKEVRNAQALKVSTDGTRLDAERADGSCIAWVYSGNALYVKKSTSAATFATTWTKRITNANLMSGKKFFTPVTGGVSYAFQLGNGVGDVALNGDGFMRLAAERTTSVCFGDAPAATPTPTPTTPAPTPTPTPTPTTPPVVTYSISYGLDNGTVSGNPTNYTNTTGSFTLNNPTRTGYTFAGWTGTALSGATTNVTVPSGSVGDRYYTATWTAIPVTNPTPAPSNLTATIAKTNGWGTTYQFRVTIKNTGSTAISNGWSASWAVPGATAVASWAGSCTKAGDTVTCINADWNKQIPAGGTLTFEGQIDGSGANIPTGTTVTVTAR